MTNTDTLEMLQALGFTAYESKAYTALLGCQPATAYEVGKQAGVPGSKIYEVLGRLAQRGVAQVTVQGDQQLYVALPPGQFLQEVRERTANQTRDLLPRLEALGNKTTTDFIWPLEDQAAVIAKSRELLGQAQDNILISCWPEEFRWLETDLQSAHERGIAIALVHFGNPDQDYQAIGANYYHPVEKTLYQEKGGRGLTLVVDSQTVVLANFKDDGDLDGAWSRNSAFVTVAEDYVKHDVYITKVTRFLNPELQQRFGQEYEKLRDIFNADA